MRQTDHPPQKRTGTRAVAAISPQMEELDAPGEAKSDADITPQRGSAAQVDLPSELGEHPRYRDKWPKDWRGVRLTLQADHIIIKSDSLPKGRTTSYKIDPSQHPRALDLDGGGFKKEWIYKVSGNTLILAFPLGCEWRRPIGLRVPISV